MGPPVKDSTPSFWIVFPPYVFKPPTFIQAAQAHPQNMQTGDISFNMF